MRKEEDVYYSLSDGSKSRSPQRRLGDDSASNEVLMSVKEKYHGGDSYEGTITRRNGTTVKEGNGRYHFGNGSVYEGDWHKGAMHGNGVFFEADTGDRFEGQWSYGRRVKGVYYFPNGDLFIGAFDVETGNKKHGRCVLVDTLVPYDAEYHDDVLVWKELLNTQPIAKRLGAGPAAAKATPRPSTARSNASPSPSAQHLLGDLPDGPKRPMDQLTAAKVVLRGNRERGHQTSRADVRRFTSIQQGSFDRFAAMPAPSHVTEALRYYR